MMTPKRLSAIINKVHEKYADQIVTPLMVQCFYNDISAVIKGLHKTEHFLNVAVDCNCNVILVKDDETMRYLGVLPYLDNRLMAKCEEPYIVYRLKDNTLYTQCGVIFTDMYQESSDSEENVLGFDLEVSPIIPLGVYYPDTDEFIELEE